MRKGGRFFARIQLVPGFFTLISQKRTGNNKKKSIKAS
jgi:hypothetical protein